MCSTSAIASVLDATALVAVAVVGGLLTMLSAGDCGAQHECPRDYTRNPLAGTIAIAAPFLVSAVYGVNEVVRCREARDEWAGRAR